MLKNKRGGKKKRKSEGVKKKKQQKKLYRLLTNCVDIMSTVFSVNLLPHKSNKSSNEGPSNSITSALYLPHGPK